jgi:hypothetical protein
MEGLFMRKSYLSLAICGVLAPCGATTLERLSLNDMIVKSTTIVHAKVTGASGAFRGVEVYTFYQIQVSETLKASGTPAPTRIEVAVPGGTAKGVRQTVPGAPNLTIGGDYVFFLWNGTNTLTQIIGLSQGLLQVSQDSAGNQVATRPAANEPMVDRGGAPVTDQGLTVRYSDLRTQIRKTLGIGN